MGSPPPPDAPPPAEQDAIGVSASFEPSPTGASICGFAIPGFSFNLSFRLPSFDLFFQFPPSFFFALSLSCDLSEGIDLEVGFGGGRAAVKVPPDPEEEAEDAA